VFLAQPSETRWKVFFIIPLGDLRRLGNAA